MIETYKHHELDTQCGTALSRVITQHPFPVPFKFKRGLKRRITEFRSGLGISVWCRGGTLGITQPQLWKKHQLHYLNVSFKKRFILHSSLELVC